MIILRTHTWNPFTKEFWKWVARKVARKFTGPDAVACSLVRGLKELNRPLLYNPLFKNGEAVIVLSSVSALKKALKLKRNGVIKKLIVGPNVVANPNDNDGLIKDEAIDIVLVPSQWVADLWVREAAELSHRLAVWPAGVEIRKASMRSGVPIIYDKLGDQALVSQVQEQTGSSAQVFTYGKFDRDDYLVSLADAPFLIYLAESESQGLALQEAWAHDVPTLVNKSEHWEAHGLTFDAPHINCPYLIPEAGVVFDNTEALSEMIKSVATLHPKLYCDAHLSDRVSAEILLKLI